MSNLVSDEGSEMMPCDTCVLDQVVDLADQYADALAESLPVVSEEMLRQVVAGTLLSFLAEALSTASHA